MPPQTLPASPAPGENQIQKIVSHCNSYREASTSQALLQLATTTTGFVALLSTMVFAFNHGVYWLDMLLLLPAAGFLVRLFIIQHDCGHNSFFPSRKANNALGRVIAILTFTPYDFWRRAHNLHHAHSGNLGKRGLGSIDTLTVAEYQALSPFRRFLYRSFRNPLVVLFIGPPVQTFIIQRFPPAQTVAYLEDYHPMSVAETWKSLMLFNLALLVCYGVAVALLGWKVLVLVYLPVVVVTSWLGGWLFYIQHQFENTWWNRGKAWTFEEAALYGSSYYALPNILQWFSGNIGLHHIHHLCAKIPNYRLQECMDALPELSTINRMTLRDSLKCVFWALWDENKRKMVTFRDLQAAV
jgi:omega-6 fatty acid desaturase (delta-12 desaturase)